MTLEAQSFGAPRNFERSTYNTPLKMRRPGEPVLSNEPRRADLNRLRSDLTLRIHTSRKTRSKGRGPGRKQGSARSVWILTYRPCAPRAHRTRRTPRVGLERELRATLSARAGMRPGKLNSGRPS